jgi:hypothetical protein
MKKVLLVLALGLAMMSCSKEELVTESSEYCNEIVDFTSVTSEAGYLLHYILINKWDGSGAFILTINEDKWLAYKAEIAEFGFACWGM